MAEVSFREDKAMAAWGRELGQVPELEIGVGHLYRAFPEVTFAERGKRKHFTLFLFEDQFTV
jgi:hypothetical protein